MPTKKAPATKAAATAKKAPAAEKAAPTKKTPAAKKPAPAKKPVVAAKPAPAKTKTVAETKTISTKSATSMKSSTATKKASAKPKTTSSVEGFASFTPYQEKKGEEYMSAPMKDHFREILRAWKRELMEEVDRTVHHMQDEAANFPDPNDRATQESEFTMELRTRDRERKLIKKIDEAVDKIDKDEYGYCESCGVEIGIRRLEARPTAALCIDCKTLDEIREKQMG